MIDIIVGDISVVVCTPRTLAVSVSISTQPGMFACIPIDKDKPLPKGIVLLRHFYQHYAPYNSSYIFNLYDVFITDTANLVVDTVHHAGAYIGVQKPVNTPQPTAVIIEDMDLSSAKEGDNDNIDVSMFLAVNDEDGGATYFAPTQHTGTAPPSSIKPHECQTTSTTSASTAMTERSSPPRTALMHPKQQLPYIPSAHPIPHLLINDRQPTSNSSMQPTYVPSIHPASYLLSFANPTSTQPHIQYPIPLPTQLVQALPTPQYTAWMNSYSTSAISPVFTFPNDPSLPEVPIPSPTPSPTIMYLQGDTCAHLPGDVLTPRISPETPPSTGVMPTPNLVLESNTTISSSENRSNNKRNTIYTQNEDTVDAAPKTTKRRVPPPHAVRLHKWSDNNSTDSDSETSEAANSCVRLSNSEPLSSSTSSDTPLRASTTSAIDTPNPSPNNTITITAADRVDMLKGKGWKIAVNFKKYDSKFKKDTYFLSPTEQRLRAKADVRRWLEENNPETSIPTCEYNAGMW